MPAARKAPATRRPVARKPKAAPAVDLAELGARVRSVFGPFNSRTLIELPTEAAERLFPGGLAGTAPTRTIDDVEHDLASIRDRAPEIADSALAAVAVALAYEMDDPYNSATSKSMCARVLLDTLERLRELAPPAQEADRLDDLTARRLKRLGRATA